MNETTARKKRAALLDSLERVAAAEKKRAEVAPLNLARTKAALEVYDVARQRFEDDESGELHSPALVALEEAEVAVGAAFALDTADRNQRDVASLMRPNAWLRGLVEKYGGA